MYAIVSIGGYQYKATPNAVLRVPRLAAEVGGEVTLDRVLLWADDKSVEIGKPYVDGKILRAEVVRHGRDKKVVIYKKKRRKKYRRKTGHKQLFTEIRLGEF